MRHFRPHSEEVSIARCLLRIFDALGFGIVLLGGDRKVLHFNRRAEQHLGSGLSVQAGYLAATDPASDRILQGILTARLSGEGKPREALGLHRTELRPLVMRIVSLEEDAQGSLDGAQLLAVLVDPESCPEPNSELLQQAFGLTRREAQVGIALMCGSTLREIASATGTVVGTIRAQSKALFAKTETKRQAELVGLLTRLAVVSAKRH